MRFKHGPFIYTFFTVGLCVALVGCGSTWRVLSIVSKKPASEYQSMVLTFQTNTKLTTLTILKDGKATTQVESYRVVDDVIVISGKDYIINAKYSIEGKQMIIVAPDIRIVMEEIEEQV